MDINKLAMLFEQGHNKIIKKYYDKASADDKKTILLTATATDDKVLVKLLYGKQISFNKVKEMDIEEFND